MSTKIKRTKEQDVALNTLNNIASHVATNFTKSNEVRVFIRHSRKLRSNQTGKFPCTIRSGNQCLMVILTVDANSSLANSFKNKKLENNR